MLKCGDILLDWERAELHRNGELCHVEPQVFDVIKYLIENRNRVVSKDDLFEAIWDGRIVSESTLNSRINAARRVFGDDGKSQSVIRTVARRGFRFVGTVEEVTQSGVASNSIADASDGTGEPRNAIEYYGKPSLVVLPFENLSSDTGQEFFADGMTDEITTLLSMVPGTFVISRNSANAYKGRLIDSRLVSSELGVRYILEGSVRTSGRQIRVSCKCTDATSRNHIWAESFDRELEDVFAVQAEIAQGIVAALDARLLLAEGDLIRRRRPIDLNAWGSIIAAKLKMHASDREDLDAAEPFARRALELDPDYGDAHAVLAHILAWRSYNGWCEDIKETARDCIRHSELALRYAPGNPAVLSDIGFARFWLGRPKESLPYLQRSMNLNPNSALTCAQYGCALAVHGRTEEGMAYCDRAIRLSPRDPMEYFFRFCMAAAHQFHGDHVGAKRAAELSLHLNPNVCWAYTILASSCIRLGELEEAQRAIDKVCSMSSAAIPNLFRAWSEGTLWHRHADPILELYDGPLPQRKDKGRRKN